MRMTGAFVPRFGALRPRLDGDRERCASRVGAGVRGRALDAGAADLESTARPRRARGWDLAVHDVVGRDRERDTSVLGTLWSAYRPRAGADQHGRRHVELLPGKRERPGPGLRPEAAADRAFDRAASGGACIHTRAARDREALRFVPHGLFLDAPVSICESEADLSLPRDKEATGGGEWLPDVGRGTRRRPEAIEPGVGLRGDPQSPH